MQFWYLWKEGRKEEGLGKRRLRLDLNSNKVLASPVRSLWAKAIHYRAPRPEGISLPSYACHIQSLTGSVWRKCGLIECGGGSRGVAAGVVSPLCFSQQDIWEAYSSWSPHMSFISLWILTVRGKKVESAHCNYCYTGRSQTLGRRDNLRGRQDPLCSWFLLSWKSLSLGSRLRRRML